MEQIRIGSSEMRIIAPGLFENIRGRGQTVARRGSYISVYALDPSRQEHRHMQLIIYKLQQGCLPGVE